MVFSENVSAMRVNNTFIELVQDDAPCGVGFRRVSSDPAVYDNFTRAHCGAEVDYALVGLSDDESEVDTPCAAAMGRVKHCGSIACSTCSTSSLLGDDESEPESECPQLDLSSPSLFPTYQPSGSWLMHYDLDQPTPASGHEAADVHRRDCAGSASSSAAILAAENERLLAQNNLLRENMRLARENQALRESLSNPAAQLPVVSHATSASKSQIVERRSSVSSRDDLSDAAAQLDETRTTVMWRNLPNNYTRSMLLRLLDESGFSALYDFVYLPVDFKTGASLGYAFINLTHAHVVPRFWQVFDGYARWAIPSKKASYVSWSDPHQGFAMNVDRYRNSPVMHASVPDEYKPAIFVNGVRMSFPLPTSKPRPPRCHKH